ncbi:MAG: HAMP domain-containing histidine kinase, partial [Cyanobacteria bacterium]|nr:HAMP domain-containing histidine kinase [Cyanobacteriota bacterium]
MKIRLSLYAQIVLVFLLNVGLLLAVRFLFVSNRMNVGWETLLYSPAAEQVQGISFAVHRQMRMSQRTTWNSILDEFGRFYGVDFYLFDMHGQQVAGPPIKLPSEVKNEIVRLSSGPIASAGTRHAPVVEFIATEPLVTVPSSGTAKTVVVRDSIDVKQGHAVTGYAEGEAIFRPQFIEATAVPGVNVGRVVSVAAPSSQLPGKPGPNFDLSIHKFDWIMDVFDPRGSAPPPMPPRVFIHTKNPDKYWIGAHIPILPDRASRRLPPDMGIFQIKLPSAGATGSKIGSHTFPPLQAALIGTPGMGFGPGILLASTPNLWTTRLMSDYKNVFFVAIGIFGFSMLIWWPFVFAITQALGKLTKATERIAQGKFDTTLNINRGDEIGRLAQAINSMSSRLNTYVTGQKRFLGDIAHELSSPVARLQLALEILEQTGREDQQPCIRDIREEAQQMSALINELLAFSKASVQGREIELTPLVLIGIVDGAIARTCDQSDVRVDVPDNLVCLGDEVLLQRAVGNVLHNAVRYAGDCGPVTVVANMVSEEICL